MPECSVESPSAPFTHYRCRQKHWRTNGESQYGREDRQPALIELVRSCAKPEIHRAVRRRMAILAQARLCTPACVSRGEDELVRRSSAGYWRHGVIRQEVRGNHAEGVRPT